VITKFLEHFIEHISSLHLELSQLLLDQALLNTLLLLEVVVEVEQMLMILVVVEPVDLKHLQVHYHLDLIQ
jgi:hypothetical protein